MKKWPTFCLFAFSIIIKFQHVYMETLAKTNCHTTTICIRDNTGPVENLSNHSLKAVLHFDLGVFFLYFTAMEVISQFLSQSVCVSVYPTL